MGRTADPSVTLQPSTAYRVLARGPKWVYKGQPDRAVGAAALTLMEKAGEGTPLGQLRTGSGRVGARLPSAITHSQSSFLHQRQARTALILPTTTCPPGNSFLY